MSDMFQVRIRGLNTKSFSLLVRKWTHISCALCFCHTKTEFLSALGFARALLNLTIIFPFGFPPPRPLINPHPIIHAFQGISMGLNESQ